MRLVLLCVLARMFVLSLDAREISDLNSGWTFRLGDVSNAERPQSNDQDWQQVVIPHCWGWEQAQKGDTNYYRGAGWYRRELKVAPASGKRFFLRFEAASSVADVYLNGHCLGEHRGGFGAFCFEITTNLSPSGTNKLAVRVSNAPQPDLAPLSGDFPVLGGIYRPVQLIETGDACVALTDHASSGVAWRQTSVTDAQALLVATVQISNGTRTTQPLNIEFKLLDAGGKVVGRTNQQILLAANCTAPYCASLEVAKPHLWQGRWDPYLYRGVVELRSTNGLPVDVVETSLGLRYYNIISGEGFYLNGKKYPIWGVCRHQDRPNQGWALSAADMKEDIALIEEIGATAVRCCHYQQSDYFYRLCDQAGLLVWAEIPQVDAIHNTVAFGETSRNQLLDLIRQNLNHPSIFVWSLFNEIGNQPTDDPHQILQDLNNLAHGEDPTRPTIAATCTDKFPAMNKIPDLLGWNTYPGWYSGSATAESVGTRLDSKRFASRDGDYCVSEYGAGANLFQHEDHPKQPKPTGQWHPEEWQAIVHEAAWAGIKSRPFVWGSFIWNMFDFTSDWRHEGGTVGLNDKGLVSYDRKTRKDAFYYYQANWSTNPVLYITSRRFTERTNDLTAVKVYSNADVVELFVNGVSHGRQVDGTNCVYRWPDILLQPGKNAISVRAQKNDQQLRDECVWQYVPPSDPRK